MSRRPSPLCLPPRCLPLLLCLAAFLAGGCASPRLSARPSPYLSYRYQVRAQILKSAARPSLDLGQAEVQDAQARFAARAEASDDEARALRAQAASGASQGLEGALSGARAAYAAGQPALAAAWVDAHPAFREWSAAADLASFEARFVRGAADEGLLEVTITRRFGAEGPLAFAFPPGTYARPASSARGFRLAPSREAERLRFLVAELVGGEGWVEPESERRWGRWPQVQDLALLEAPVVALARHQTWARVQVPVACAVFDRLAPEPGQVYTLASFASQSPARALLSELCRRRAQPSEAQLALWLAREDLEWESFRAREGDRGRIANFADGSPVLPRHAAGAAELLLRAGLDPTPLRFFAPSSEPGQVTAPEAERAPPAPPEGLSPAPEAEPQTARRAAPRVRRET